MWLRHLVSIAILPFTVVVLIPLWIARRYGVEPSLGGSGPAWVLQLAGLGLLVVGPTFFAASLRRFGTEGAGRSPRGIPRDGSCYEVRTATSAIR